MKRNQWTGPRGLLLSCSAAALVAMLAVSPARAAVYSDDFETNHPYSLGIPNGIWTDTYNMDQLNGGLFESNPDGQGQLVVDNIQGQGYGWSGGQSNAPLISLEVDGGLDWTAIVEIDAQTNIGYSGAGFVARAKGPAVPGPSDFVAFYSFRYWDAAANPALDVNGSTLLKQILDGNDQPDDKINPAFGTPLPDAALPILLKLVRIRNTFIGYYSPDNGATWLFQNEVTARPTSDLLDPSIPIDLGLTYQTFVANPGQARFDNFWLETRDRVVPEPTTAGLMVIALMSFVGVARRRSA